MANGYLGKISAVISANTADFQAKLNASARDVATFAQRVERDLGTASRDAAKSLNNIYTPLQKLDRALKAATSMKLSFRGFDGAIRNVEELSQRLAALGKRQVDVNVRGTGFKTAAQLHDAIRGITSKDVKLVASVGGLENARQMVAALREADEFGKKRGTVIGRDTETNVTVKVKQTELEEAVAKFGQIKSIQQIETAIRLVGGRQLEDARRQLLDTVKLAEGVGKPLERAAQSFAALPVEIQAEFLPALVAVQSKAERVKGSLEKTAMTGRTFNRLSSDVRGVAQSIEFLDQAVKSLKPINARSLFDRAPAVKLAFDASAAASQSRDQQPAFVTRNTGVMALDEKRLDAVQKLITLYARLEAEEARGEASNKTNARLERQLVVVRQLTDSFNELVASTKGAAFDEIALQANRANAIFSALSPQAARGLLGLQQQANELVRAYSLTGQGAAEAEVAVRRLAAASATAAGGDRLRGAADALGAGTPLAGIEAAAAKAQAAFDALPESLRARFQPELQRTLREAAALGDAVAASGDKGDGAIERMVSSLQRLQSSFQTTGGAADIGQTLSNALSRVRVSQPLNLSEIARQATEAVGEFETLSAPIRRQLIPAFSEAIGRAAELTRRIQDGGRASAVEIGQVANAVGSLTERLKSARDASALLNTGLFRNPGGSVGVDQLNQEVQALSDTFRTLPAATRSLLAPFVKDVKDARTALREGTGSAREYQAAVAALAAASKSLAATSGAFLSDNSAAGRAAAVAELEARINAASAASESFGRAGRRALQEVAAEARATAAAFAAGTGTIAAARKAVEGLEASVASTGRQEGIADLFRVGSEGTRLTQLVDSMGTLNERFNALDIAQRRSLQGLAQNLRNAANEALEAGRATAQLRNAVSEMDAAISQSEEMPAESRRRREFANTLLPPVLQEESNLISNQGAATDIRDRLARGARLRDEQERLEQERQEASRRRAFASTLLPPVLQTESNLLSNQGAATDVRDRIARGARLREEQERREQEQEEARRRREFANQFVLPPVSQEESQLLSFQGRATQLREGYFEESLRSRASQSLGSLPNDPRRMLSGVGQSINSLQDQIANLPGPLQARLIPAIMEARDEFIQLNALGPHATAQAIEAARLRLVHLTQDASRAAGAMNFSQSFGGEGVTGVNLGLDQNALRGVGAQLQILQGYIGRVSREARGPAVAAFNELRNAAAAAFAEGTLGTPGVEGNLRRLRNQATRTTAALAGVSASTIGRELRRAGDIGRQGLDKWSLALNQGAFAVDDFLSSTGGLEFKLRAISNNITQLAFVLGGTTGLFIGLGTVIGGQVALGILKFINNGRTAEDQTKALNDALARQKSLAEELGQAFRSLGDSLSRGLFSEAGERAAEFSRQLDEIRRKQAEAVRNSVADLDPEVIRERAEQRKLQRQIEKSENVGEIVGLERQLAESRRREKAAADRTESAATPALDAVARELRASLERMAVAAQMDRVDEESDLGQPFRERADAVGLPASVSDARAVLEENIADLAERVDGGFLSSNEAVAARREIARLESLLNSLTAPLARELNNAANEIASAARGPAERIRQAQEEVAKAIEAGLPGARLFGLELDAAANRLAEANKRLEQFASGKDENGRELTDEERTKRVAEARAEVDVLSRQQAEIEARSDAQRRERTVDPQRQIDARMGRAAGNLQAAGLENGQIARRMREIEYERETIRRQAQLPEFQNPMAMRLLEQQEAALKAEAAAIEAATIQLKAFADALNRSTEEAKANLNSAQQTADEARRADLAMSTPETQAARRRAENDLERQRELERRVQVAAALERDRRERQAASPEATRIREIDEQLQGRIPVRERAELIRERDRLQAQIDEDARRGQATIDAERDAATRDAEQARLAARGEAMARTPEQQFQLETDQGMEAIRQYFARQAEADNGLIDLEAQREAQKRYMEERDKEFRQQTAVGRGRDLGMTEQERFMLDFRQGPGADIAAAARDMQARGQDPTAFMRQALRNQMEQVAPMLQQFQDERQNAMLQGPSRAALQVSDVTTVQGASELTRLLRGDDAARNENLVELQKQSQKLDTVIEVLRQNVPGVLL